jgi:transcriptional regulator with XRE-family HTH domain
MPAGRPSEYKKITERVIPTMAQIERMAAKGFTNSDFADVFGVDVSAIKQWMRDRPEFLAAIRRGKSKANKNVVKSLYERARGYKHKAVKIMQYEGSIIKEEYIEHYPPDTEAAKFWLKNREPEEWKDKQEIESTGSMVNANVDLTSVSTEKLKKIRDLMTSKEPDAAPKSE